MKLSAKLSACARCCISCVTAISLKPSGIFSSAPQRNAGGISSNSASMLGALIAASISFTSVSVCGMNGMSVVHGYGSRNSARNSDSQRLEKILVRPGLEQAVATAGVGRIHLPHPTLVAGVVLEDIRPAAQLAVVG